MVATMTPIRGRFFKYAVEQIGTTQIARFLTAEGYRTYRGSSSWKSNKIVKILNNEKYAGDLVQKKSYTPNYLNHEKKRNTGEVPLVRIENHHEAIISREIWELAQEKLRRNNKHRAGTMGHSNRYVFSGKIKCGECGGSFVGRQKKLQDGSKIRRWCCGKEKCGIGRLVRDDDAMNMLKTAIRHLNVDREALVNDVTALVLRSILAEGERKKDRPENLHHEMEGIAKKKEMLLDSFLEGDISREEMRAMKIKYDGQLEELRQRLEKMEETQTPQTVKAEIQAELMDLLNGETESEVFYKHLLERLTVFKDRHLELKLNHLPMVFRFV